MTSLTFFEEAGDEIEHERSWYRGRSASAEASLLRELDQAFAFITEAPKRWPRYIGGTRRFVLPTFPFSLVYFMENDTVFVVALAPQSRRPGYSRKRLS